MNSQGWVRTSTDAITMRIPTYGAAMLIARADRRQLDVRASDRLGGPLPPPGTRHVRGDISALGFAPGRWLLLDAAAPDAGRLLEMFADVAAVTDQSDGLLHARISGPDAHLLLRRKAGMDLGDRRFPAGSCASTMLALTRVYISRLDDRPSFELSVPRSFGESVAEFLDLAVRDVAAAANPA